jgi:all-trans-retinol 13,14-reductase
LKNTYDILIIGAGLGGLQCASILSRKGFSVCVLEKNKNPGGTLQNFHLGESTFSSGMHYLGSLNEGQILNKLFRYFNILDGLKLKKMGEDVFDRFIIGESQVDYPMGWDKFEEKMNGYFPTEKKAISAYTAMIRSVADSQAIYNLQPPNNYDIRKNPHLEKGIYPAVKSITKNIDLQNALTALNFVYAGDKNSSSLYTHALINNYYIQSAWRLRGGSAQIAELLSRNISQNGGKVFTEKEVSKLVFTEDKLCGVELKSGETIFGKKIISNIHPALTVNMIPEGKVRKSFRNRLSTLPNTISVFGLHLRLKPGKVPYLNHNLHFYRNKDVWPVTSYSKDKWPGYFYLYTPAGEDDGVFTDSLSIYSYMNFDEVANWAGVSKAERGNVYQEWKEKKASLLIDEASKLLPELKGNIIDWIAATPLTYRDYIGTTDGAMYGTLRDYHDPMASYIFPRTKIPNLFFTGQNINLHGMLGVSISSLLTCGEIIGLPEIIKEVNDDQA